MSIDLRVWLLFLSLLLLCVTGQPRTHQVAVMAALVDERRAQWRPHVSGHLRLHRQGHQYHPLLLHWTSASLTHRSVQAPIYYSSFIYIKEIDYIFLGIIRNIIIIWRNFLHRREVVMSSRIMHSQSTIINSLAHIYTSTCAFISVVVAEMNHATPWVAA